MTMSGAKPKTETSAANLLPPSTNGQASGDLLQRAISRAVPRSRAPADSSLAAQHEHETHSIVGGKKLSGGHSETAAHSTSVAAELLFCAEFLDDVEKVRIATQNRMRAMGEAEIDGESYAKQVEAFLALEHEATLALRRVVRQHPLGDWIKRTVGVGEKQGARLLAAIGDPAYNHAAGRPRRGPAELWAYCGFVPGQKRQKGVKSNWNATAKMRAFLIAESCIKCRRSPYRAVYDAARANWSERDVKDGHKHNHALRVTAKAILRDLFLEARKAAA